MTDKKNPNRIVEKVVVTNGRIGSFFDVPKEDLSVTYPKSKNLHINQSDLKLELIHFAKANENKPNIGLVIGIISVWIAIFTGDFHDAFGLSADNIRTAIIVLALFSTFILATSLWIVLYRFMVSLSFVRKKIDRKEWIDKNEIDPERKAESIIEKCEER